MLADFITAHGMQTEAREALGWEASDDDVLLAAIVLTLMRRGGSAHMTQDIFGRKFFPTLRKRCH